MTLPKTSQSADADSEGQWFYKLLGLATGPVSLERVAWLIEQQHLTAESQVGPAINGPWQRLDDSALASLLPSATVTSPPPVEIAGAKRAVQVPAPQVPTRRKRRRAKAMATVDEDISDGIEIDFDQSPEPSESEPEPSPQPVEPKSVPAPLPQPAPTAIAETQVDILGETSPDIETAPVSSPSKSAERPVEPLPGIEKPTPVHISQPPKPNKTRSQPKASNPPNNGTTTKRQQIVRYVAIGVAVLTAAWFLAGFFRGSPNTTEAAQVFERVMAEFDSNGEMSDIEFAKWVKDSREQVSAHVEPLREFANADEPEIQSLMWAGDRLLIMLKGARTLPPGVRTRYEAYMADYRGDPPPVRENTGNSGANPEGEAQRSPPEEPMDPIF